MTAPRQRPARPPPPVSSREAALVGALTAFAKSTSASKPTSSTTVNSRPVPVPGNKPQLTTSTISEPKATSAKDPPTSGKLRVPAPVRPVRNDSGTARQRDTEEKAKVVVAPVAVQSPKPRRQIVPPAASEKPSDDRPGPRDRIADSLAEGQDDPLPASAVSLIRMFESQAKTEPGSSKVVARSGTTSTASSKPDRSLPLAVTPLALTAKSTTSPTVAPVSAQSDKTDLSSPASFQSAKAFLSPLKEKDMPREHTPISRPSGPSSAPIQIPQRLSIPPRRESHDTQFSVSPSDLGGHSPITGAQNIPLSQRALYSLHDATASTASITATFNALHPRKQSALSTEGALANAIVASSLASSRAPSPMHLNPPQSQHRHHLFSRTPSPPKQLPSSSAPTVLRTTLRPARPDSPSSAEDDPYAKHKRKRHLRKHANKYAEGDRKRWRNAVTPTERARYEGVWAANRGTLPGAETDDVHALAVKEVWSRSRLPAHVLQEIWGLVAREDVPLLSREEFVVGMWLIDQRLKGRKLPVRVHGSVWESVRVVAGIRIRHREVGTGGW